MNNYKLHSMIAAFIFAAMGILTAQESKHIDPKPTLEAFLKSEFDGNEDSYTMITLSGGMQARIRKEHKGEKVSIGNMIASPFNCTPLMVVNSYRILGLVTSGATATAEVEYEVVGEFIKGDGEACATTFVRYGGKRVKEVLRLRYSDGKNGMGWIRGTAWYLEDPPLPKVSLVAMERICRKELDKFQLIEKRARERSIDVPSNIYVGIMTFKKKVESLNSLKTSGE